MLPLLDGSWDRTVIIDSLSSYSRESVASFLDLLEERGLLETITDERPSARRWRGQREFFRQWSNRPDELASNLQTSRVGSIETLA
jgi:hypothetical protein